MDWLSELDEWDLVGNASCLAMMQLNDTITIDNLLPFMVKGGPTPPRASIQKDEEERAKEFLKNDPRPPIKYWHAVKEEINDLICGNPEKYEELRKKIVSSIEIGEKSLVALIATNVAVVLGVEVGLISAFCAMCLFSARKVGINAYCRKIGKNVT